MVSMVQCILSICMIPGSKGQKHEKVARSGRILNVFEDCESTKCEAIGYHEAFFGKEDDYGRNDTGIRRD